MLAAKLLTINNLDPADYIDEIDVFLFDISIVGTIAALWVMFVLSMTKKAYMFPHQLTFLLALCQATACIGMSPHHGFMASVAYPDPNLFAGSGFHPKNVIKRLVNLINYV